MPVEPRHEDDLSTWTQYPAEVLRSLHAEARAALDDKLSPTLRRDIEATPEKVYAGERHHAELSPRAHGEENTAQAFPAKRPYSLDEIWQQDWYPVSSGR